MVRLDARAGLLRQLALGRAGPRGERVLPLRLHDGAQAAYDAEHRVGRPRGLLPDPDRLDRRHRRARLAAGGAVPGGLLLDAAAHLGAGDALPRGLRARRRADAARRQGRRGRRPPDRRLLVGDGRDLAAAVAGGRHALALPDRRGRPRRRVPGRGPPDVAPRPHAATSSPWCGRCGCSTGPTCISRCSSSPSRWTR